MTGLSDLRFATRDELRAFERAMSGFFWAGDFAGAEQALQSAMREHPSSFSDICQTIPQGAVSIGGWDELCAEIESPSRKDHRYSAIEIDLSGHADREVEAGGVEPGFECSYYDDSIYSFSTASHDEMLAQCKAGSVAWQGGFVEIDHALSCDGLRQIYSSLVKYPHRRWRLSGSDPVEVPQDFVAFMLGFWFLYLRVHQALRSELRTRGLPQRMPVVVDQHSFGPPLSSVYMSETICDSAEATRRVLAQRQAEVRAYDKITEDEVRGFRTRRDGIRSWPFFRKRRQRKIYIEYSQAHENITLSHSGLSTNRPTWKMSNAAFESLIARYRSFRASQRP